MSFLLSLSQSAKWTVWGMGFGPLPPSFTFPFVPPLPEEEMGRGRASLKDFVISLSVHQVWRPLSLEAKKYENIGSVHGCSSRSEYFFPFFKSHSEPNSFSSAPQFGPLFGQLQSRDPPNLGPALGGPSQQFMGYGRIGGLPPPFLSLSSFAPTHLKPRNGGNYCPGPFLPRWTTNPATATQNSRVFLVL